MYEVLSPGEDMSHTCVGTPYYMSPEIIKGEPYDKSVDIFATGCVVHEMCTLQRTFEATNLPAIITKVVEGKKVLINSNNEHNSYPQSLQNLIDRFLDSYANNRPTAKQVIQENGFGDSVKLQAKVLHACRETPTRVENSKSSRSTSMATPEPANGSGSHQSTFLTKTTQLKMWGAGSTPKPFDFFAPSTDFAPTMVAASEAHIGVVTIEKELFTWNTAAIGDGDGHSYGQLGHGDFGSVRNPKLVKTLSACRIEQVECGQDFTVALDSGGSVYTFGCGMDGCLGDPDDNGDRSTPSKIKAEAFESFQETSLFSTISPFPHVVEMIACGDKHVLALTRNKVAFSWGNGEFGRLGLGPNDEEDRFEPNEIKFDWNKKTSKFVPLASVTAGFEGSMFISENGRVYACGNNASNKLGLDKTESLAKFHRKTKPNSSNSTGVEEGSEEGQINLSTIPTIVSALKSAGRFYTQVSIGHTHAAAISSDGDLFVFGDNTFGQLGSGDSKPCRGANLVRRHRLQNQKVKHVACGRGFTVAALEDNTVCAWGKTAHCRLGRQSNKTKTCAPSVVNQDLETVIKLCCSGTRTLLISEKVCTKKQMDQIDIEICDTHFVCTQEEERIEGDDDDSDGGDAFDSDDDTPAWLQAELSEEAIPIPTTHNTHSDNHVNTVFDDNDAIHHQRQHQHHHQPQHQHQHQHQHHRDPDDSRCIHPSHDDHTDDDLRDNDEDNDDDLPSWLVAELADPVIPIANAQYSHELDLGTPLQQQDGLSSKTQHATLDKHSCHTDNNHIPQMPTHHAPQSLSSTSLSTPPPSSTSSSSLPPSASTSSSTLPPSSSTSSSTLPPSSPTSSSFNASMCNTHWFTLSSSPCIPMSTNRTERIRMLKEANTKLRRKIQAQQSRLVERNKKYTS